ncbi:tail assembly protein [Vibrio fluvialis]|uniref:tail assembly protein n=1 Tax=Vibrio fluvialis TaxID=676 RepID=UPI002B2595EA|nr:tail assembly protein [Vibrio fluvialis]WPK51694.1 tail assembly protein [Vibrio fluvialis]
MQNETPRTVRLYGKLGAKFGRVHKFVCNTPAEAVRALSAMVPGFQQEMMESRARGIDYAVFIGKDNITEDCLDAPAGGQDIRIAPIISGSGRGFQVVAGVALAAIGAYTYNPYLVSAGLALAVGGAVQYMVKVPNGNTGTESADNGASYNFNGPVNVTAQGNPIPTLYGELITGSVTVSGDMYSETQQ